MGQLFFMLPPHLPVIFVCNAWSAQRVRAFLMLTTLGNWKVIHQVVSRLIILQVLISVCDNNFIIIPVNVLEQIKYFLSLFLCNFKSQRIWYISNDWAARWNCRRQGIDIIVKVCNILILISIFVLTID